MTFRAARYPQNWRAISLSIRRRAGDVCECSGECGDAHDGGRCSAPNGQTIQRVEGDPAMWRPHNHTESCAVTRCGATKVILTVAHLDHDEQHNDPGNLLAVCSRCHFGIDRTDNANRRRQNLAQKRAVGFLPGVR